MATEKRAITRVLTSDLSRQTSGHVKMSQWKMTSFDLKLNWALVGIDSPPSSQLDPMKVLLHKVHGQWKIVTLGTALYGSGKQFGVPRSLWKGWNLQG